MLSFGLKLQRRDLARIGAYHAHAVSHGSHQADHGQTDRWLW